MKQNLVGILLFFAVEAAYARKCYVCGPNADKPFLRIRRDTDKPATQNLSIPTCEEFENTHNSDDLEKFVRECPPQYVGCTTQVDGSNILRTCDSLTVNDCKRANGVDYCYCTSDLCNNKKAEFIRETQQKEQEVQELEPSSKQSHHQHPTDDEDLAEGSGQELDRHGKKIYVANKDPIKGDSEDESDEEDDDADVTTATPTSSVVTVQCNLIVLLTSYLIIRFSN